MVCNSMIHHGISSALTTQPKKEKIQAKNTAIYQLSMHKFTIFLYRTLFQCSCHPNTGQIDFWMLVLVAQNILAPLPILFMAFQYENNVHSSLDNWWHLAVVVLKCHPPHHQQKKTWWHESIHRIDCICSILCHGKLSLVVISLLYAIFILGTSKNAAGLVFSSLPIQESQTWLLVLVQIHTDITSTKQSITITISIQFSHQSIQISSS